MTKAIILFSGGLDSTVVLALALAKGCECYALSFDYGQRHHDELQSARAIADFYKVHHQIISLDSRAFATSSLVSDLTPPQERTRTAMANEGIPNTYVPARNTLFLAYALGLCELYQADEIHFGPNRLDHSCYPDCRKDYLDAFQQVMRFATKQAVEGRPPRLVTPLLQWEKTEIICQGLALKAPLDMTWSCYSPISKGKPCQKCDACVLREEGFKQADQ